MNSRIYCDRCGHNLRREGFRGMLQCGGWVRVPEPTFHDWQQPGVGLMLYASVQAPNGPRFNVPMYKDGKSCTQAQDWLIEQLRVSQTFNVDAAALALAKELLAAARL